MKKLLVTSALLSFLPAIAMAGSIDQLNGPDTQKIFEDKTITTLRSATLNGEVIDITFTGYFGKDGSVTGRFAEAPANNPQTNTGTWKVGAKNDLCVTWKDWNHGTEQCMMLYKLSNAILVVGSKDEFNSVILDKDIQSGNKM